MQQPSTALGHSPSTDAAMPSLEPMSAWGAPTPPAPPTAEAHARQTDAHPMAPEDVHTAAAGAHAMDVDHPPTSGGEEASEAFGRTPRGASSTPAPAASSASPAAATGAPLVVASSKGRSKLARTMAAYEVIDLATQSSDDDSDADEWAEQRRRRGRGRASEYPEVESFDIDVRTTRVVSGRALRRQYLPQFYPTSPAAPEEAEEKDNPAAAAAAVAAAAAAKRNSRKRQRLAEMDYYDTTDSFIDDSELLGEEAEAEAEAASAAAAATAHSSASGRLGDSSAPCLTPEQLHTLYSTFHVTSPAILQHQAEQAALRAAEKAIQRKKAKAQATANAATGATSATGKSKSKQPTASTASAISGSAAAASAAAAAAHAAGTTTSKKHKKPDGSANGTAAASSSTHGSSTKERSTGEREEAAGGGGGGGSGGGADASKPPPRKRQRKSAAATETAATPEAAPGVESIQPATLSELGSLDKDWLPCFAQFRPTPSVLALLDEMMTEYYHWQTGEKPPTTLANQTAVTGSAGGGDKPPTSTQASALTTQMPQPPQQADGATPMDLTSDTPTPAAAAAADQIDLTQDLPPSSTPTDHAASAPSPSATPAAHAANRTTRVGLRQKSSASIVAHKPPGKMPDAISRLLGRLGATLEQQHASELTLRAFLAVLTVKLVWTRKLIRDRLTVGRLEGQVAGYLRERFELYVRLRDAVREDIQRQAKMHTDKQQQQQQQQQQQPLGDQGSMQVEEASSHQQQQQPDLVGDFYRPDWDRLKRLLLDFTTYTDDILDAIEEIESFLPKKLTQQKQGAEATTTTTAPSAVLPTVSVSNITINAAGEAVTSVLSTATPGVPLALASTPAPVGAAATSAAVTLAAAAASASSASAAASASASLSSPSSEDVAEGHAIRSGLVTTLWLGLGIPEERYPKDHLPLLLSLTNTVYAALPLLWMWPMPKYGTRGTTTNTVGASGEEQTSSSSAMMADVPATLTDALAVPDAAALATPSSSSSACRLLVSESTIESFIDEAERAEQEAIAASDAAIEAEAKRVREEKRREEERRERERLDEERREKEKLERDVAELLQTEERRKAAKAAALAEKAAATAAAAAAALAEGGPAAASPKPKKPSATASGSGGDGGGGGTSEEPSGAKKKAAPRKPRALVGGAKKDTRWPPLGVHYASLPSGEARWKPVEKPPPSDHHRKDHQPSQASLKDKGADVPASAGLMSVGLPIAPAAVASSKFLPFVLPATTLLAASSPFSPISPSPAAPSPAIAAAAMAVVATRPTQSTPLQREGSVIWVDSPVATERAVEAMHPSMDSSRAMEE